MGVELFVNDVRTTLAVALGGLTTNTSATLASGTGFPSPTGGDLTRLRIEPAAPDGTYEIVNMTGRSGNVVTIARNQEGTPVATWPIGSIVRPVLTAASMTSFFQIVIYAGSVSVARPVAEMVVWENFPTQPTNMLSQDLWLPPADPVYDRAALMGPTGTVRTNVDRTMIAMANQAPASGTLYLFGVYHYAGDVLTAMNVRVGTGGTTGGTHSWAVVCDINRAVVAVSPDSTTAVNAAGTKTFTFTAPYTVPTNGIYYYGIMAAATTFPILGIGSIAVGQQSVPPAYGGTSSTAQTTPPNLNDVMGAITPVGSIIPWMWTT